MEYKDAKRRFIQEWGILGASWGINRTMAQVHALLLISPEPLSTDKIMEELQISRGNANMNIRNLIDWGIVFKEIQPRDRKDYFYTSKDIWALSRQIIKERRKREILPVLDMLKEVKQLDKKDSAEEKEFNKTIKEIDKFVKKTDNLIEKTTSSDKNWFMKVLLKTI